MPAIMSHESLDIRLAELLEQRKSKATYRSLKEYRTVQSANGRAGPSTEQLVDFVSGHGRCISGDTGRMTRLCMFPISRRTTTYP